jgi:hypothetical protein
MTIGATKHKIKVLAFDITTLLQTLKKILDERWRRFWRREHSQPCNDRTLGRSLSPRGQRPRQRRAASDRDELAPPHVAPENAPCRFRKPNTFANGLRVQMAETGTD